ncbi:MAG TPA: HIT domain-containing protein, partial [Planctomycetes bacterium]|nr:HIT domain-containing protein [Planctomycetota bacterium]
MDCIFCQIVAGTIPSDRVHETDHLIVFRDIDPKAPTHLLVV